MTTLNLGEQIHSLTWTISLFGVNDAPASAVEQLQEASNRLEEWKVANHMEIQPDKVCWMLVTLGKVNRELLNLTYAADVVSQETQVGYLGVVIDCRLTMVKYISNNMRKPKKALSLNRYAARQNTEVSSLVNLVRATVLSRLEYALHICCPISDSQNLVSWIES